MSPHPSSCLAIAALCVAVLGCEEPPARAQHEESPTPERMAHHFEQATRARDALVRGDLASAHRAARELTRDEGDETLRAAELEAMREAAREVASARDVETASRALGDIARACGECHRVMGADAQGTEWPAPPSGDLRARMRRHFWATDRLWDGVTMPDPGRYAAGAAELAEAPLFPPDRTTAQAVSPEVRELAERVREVARAARRARDGASRARAYGEVLGTCADCHRLVGAGGPAEPVEL